MVLSCGLQKRRRRRSSSETKEGQGTSKLPHRNGKSWLCTWWYMLSFRRQLCLSNSLFPSCFLPFVLPLSLPSPLCVCVCSWNVWCCSTGTDFLDGLPSPLTLSLSLSFFSPHSFLHWKQSHYVVVVVIMMIMVLSVCVFYGDTMCGMPPLRSPRQSEGPVVVVLVVVTVVLPRFRPKPDSSQRAAAARTSWHLEFFAGETRTRFPTRSDEEFPTVGSWVLW